MRQLQRAWLAWSCGLAIAAPLATADEPAVAPATSAPVTSAPATSAPVTSAPAATDEAASAPVALGQRFESQSAGISFCPPAAVRLADRVNPDYVAEWVDAKLNWRLTVGRRLEKEAMPLVAGPNNFGKEMPGLLETTVERLKAAIPGCKILRQDVTNIAEGGIADTRKPNLKRPNVGLIVIRFTTGGKRYLSQQALIQASERLYYLLTFTTPGSKASEDDAPEDPAERTAVEVFAAMLDTVRLTDRGAARQDQEDRLDKTRALLVNLTGKRLRDSLVKEQWLRVIKDGKDVGYSYITEETAANIPRPPTAAEMRQGKGIRDLIKPGDGILIGIRARMLAAGVRSNKTKGEIQTDSQAWFFVSGDSKHEDWTRVVISDDHINPEKNYLNEFGSSDRRVKPKVIMPRQDGGLLPAGGKRQEPVMTTKDDYELDVTLRTNREAPEPITRQLAPWYIPQAVGQLLPRLMPRNLKEPKKYLFATYVSETREVMHRYVDVLPEQRVKFNGQAVRAIQVRDRLGIDGLVTTHYIDVKGTYLGSENIDEKIVVLPTDPGTLSNIWKNADLRTPDTADRNVVSQPPQPQPHDPAAPSEPQ